MVHDYSRTKFMGLCSLLPVKSGLNGLGGSLLGWRPNLPNPQCKLFETQSSKFRTSYPEDHVVRGTDFRKYNTHGNKNLSRPKTEITGQCPSEYEVREKQWSLDGE